MVLQHADDDGYVTATAGACSIAEYSLRWRQELLQELVGMLSISCDGVAEGMRSPPGSAADTKLAFRAAERAMAAALRIHRRVRELVAVAPNIDMATAEATTSRVAGQVRL